MGRFVRRYDLLMAITVVSLVIFCSHLWIHSGKTETEKSSNPRLKMVEKSSKSHGISGQSPDEVKKRPTGPRDLTIVTALIDIGRGNWKRQVRKFEKYLSDMKNMMSLNVNMVIYIEEKGRKFVEQGRSGYESKTKIKTTTFQNLEYYKYLKKMGEIMNSTEFKRDNKLYQLGNCEAIYPEYNIMCNSKFTFLRDAMTWNPFNSGYFCWMDAGYGKGDASIFPKDKIWKPKNLFEHSDKVTLIKRGNVEEFRNKKDLNKYNVNLLAGNMFCGGREVFLRFTDLHRKLMEEWITTNFADDDQTAIMMLYFRHGSMFRLVPGDWYEFLKKKH